MKRYIMRFPKEVIEALNHIEAEILPHYNEEDIYLFYFDWRRRAELLQGIAHLVSKGATILDAGSAPGFTSLALMLLGYEVYSLDINPEPYIALLEQYGIKVIKADLEDEVIPIEDESVDCVVFTEVLEHLHPYKISFTLSEINRVLKHNGLLYLTTPNVASIGKRTRLLLGLQPIGKMHVKEYTATEVCDMLIKHGFKSFTKVFSLAYNLTPHNAKGKDFRDNLMKASFKYPTKENFFHVITFPSVFAIPQLRATIKIVARKEQRARQQVPDRRF